jgi:hypothetical protein
MCRPSRRTQDFESEAVIRMLAGTILIWRPLLQLSETFLRITATSLQMVSSHTSFEL